MRHTLRAWLKNHQSFWWLNTAVWLGVAVATVIGRLAIDTSLPLALGLTAVQVPTAFLLSVVLRRFYQIPRISNPFDVWTAAWIIGLSLIAGMLQSGVMQVVNASVGWNNPNFAHHIEWLIRLIHTWLVFMAWSLGYFAIRAELESLTQAEKARKARNQARRIELQMLRAQLDPHFLFNSLNSIAAEIPPHPDAALDMVHELSDYLRYSLNHRNQPTGALSSELDAVTAYLRIQRARFRERLHTVIDADSEARARLVPSFLLQPLVENAVKHGFDSKSSVWELRLLASTTGSFLRIEVWNSGHLREHHEEHEGVGLGTLRRRLALYYPGRHSFALVEENGYVIARMILEGEPCSV